MKTAVVLFALVALAFSAPQPKKVFHENFEDFIDVIQEEAGEKLFQIITDYQEYDEFLTTVSYIQTADFKNLIYEMEALPEFKAVLDYMDGHSIDIYYFIDLFNNMIENGPEPPNKVRHSGQDFNSFVKDSTAVFPKDKLAALFESKLAEDDEFRAAIEGLQSDEFNQLLDALFESPTFRAEIDTLASNGIDIDVILDEILAIFGQEIDYSLRK